YGSVKAIVAPRLFLMGNDSTSRFPRIIFHQRRSLICEICRFDRGPKLRSGEPVWNYDRSTQLIFSPIRGFLPLTYIFVRVFARLSRRRCSSRITFLERLS